jgi:hypothetical protein
MVLHVNEVLAHFDAADVERFKVLLPASLGMGVA